MIDIDKLVAALVAREGGFVNNPADRGGPTQFGITLARARTAGFTGPMQALPLATAQSIYKADYWLKPHLDLVGLVAPLTAAEMFDTGVNGGPATAVMMLQRTLNALQGTTLARDGSILPGGSTLAVLRAYMTARAAQDGDAVLCAGLNALQGERYVEIVEKDASQRQFLFGWLRNRVAA